MARGVHSANESAGGIGKILGVARVSGASTGGRGAEGAAFQRDECADIKRCANDIGRTEGGNPGNAPHRGLTQAGVVEKFIDVTLGAGSLSAEAGPLPTSFMPTDVMKK